VTASDATDGTKTANTSTAIPVNAAAFAKLQILVPGETGRRDPFGQNGNPTAQTAGTAFYSHRHAVDANWNVVNTNDTAAITSSDANAVLPANAALINGTRNFSVILKTGGSATVTASDVTHSAIPANTSPSITVNTERCQTPIAVPGETAAPGTATGKTGTPTAENVGVSFIVTVNGVDSSWNVVTSVPTLLDYLERHYGNAALSAALVQERKHSRWS